MSNVYQRQEELKDWDQDIISKLTCLILGVGGLGTNIANNLCRLGVKKIILIDMDIVECHNLNRQILFKHEDIGLLKVESAAKELERHNNVNNTEIEYYNIDALKNWNVVIREIIKSNIVFNTIDYGDYFDIAVCNIAKKYNIPVVLGGTEPFYGHTVSYFLQGIRQIDPTYLECHDIKEIKCWNKTTDFELFDDISFLPKDSVPSKGGSTVYSAGTCSHLMTSAIINYLFHLDNETHPDPPKQVIFNLLTMESNSWFTST